MPDIRPVICPECEGYGKSVDYFTIPNDRLTATYDTRQIIRPPEPTRSDGYYYTEHRCGVCNGSGRILCFFRDGKPVARYI